MRIASSFGLALLALAAAAPAAAAEYTFSFTPYGSGFGTAVSGSGIFTTSDTAMIVGGQTAYAITGISGAVAGSMIVAPTMASYGNYFTTGPSFLDGSGVNFSTASGRTVAFFNQSNTGLYKVNTFSPGSSFNVNAISAAVPEPGTWMMMVVGFALVGSALRRRMPAVRFA